MSFTGTLQVTTVGDREVRLVREFDAPRHLVWDCFTKPELVRRWLFGPDGWSFLVCDIDLRVGGSYRYVWKKDVDGTEMGMTGVYREIVPHERIVDAQIFDHDWTGGEAIGTVLFIERNGRTTVDNTMLYASREARDMVLQSGMKEGMAMGYDRLEEFMATRAERTAVMQKITPFLWFDGKAEEATNFYVGIFPNARVLSVNRQGKDGPVFSTTFNLDGQDFFALNGGPMFSFTPAISFFVNCETQAEVDELWGKLTEGGSEEPCGWLKDKYGMSWQIVPSAMGQMLGDKDPKKAQGVMTAMCKMKKIDIAGLQKAYDEA